MTDADIQQAIFAALRNVAPEVDPSTIQPEANLREALDIDSFDFLNFPIGVHEKQGVEIPERDYGQLTSLSRLALSVFQAFGAIT